MKKINGKKWVYGILAAMVVILTGCTILVITIDPYLHYRLPQNRLSYSITSERYQNDGIIRLFDYDAVITGTSMTENFKTSQLDDLFHVKSVKVPFSGGSYKEINYWTEKALKSHPDIKMVVRSIDLSMLVQEKDYMKYESYPEYLYDEKWWNDVNYWLNKMTILEGICQNVFIHSMVTGLQSTSLALFSFDEYANWNDSAVFGKEAVLAGYERPDKVEDTVYLSEQEKQIIRENITQNVTALARKYPDTKFYFFITPYSICYWDSLHQEGKISWEVEAQKIAIEEMLTSDNIELYSFCNDFETVCNLGNYKDEAHYGEDINALILSDMKNEEYKLTSDNYEDYLKSIYDFYSTYDYDTIFTDS